MGCWSESCCLSGMEIGYNREAYAGLLTPNTYRSGAWMFVQLPMLGTYDDYGGLTLAEDVPSLDLKAGDRWSPRDYHSGNPRAGVFFVDREVFDYLRAVEHDFVRNGLRTVGDSVTSLSERVRRLGAHLSMPVPDYTTDPNAFRNWFQTKDELRAHWLLDDVDGPIKDSALRLAEDAKEPAMLEEFVRGYSRVMTVWLAARELRKEIAPVPYGGPQHGGADALIPFYDFVLGKALARKAEEEAL